MMDDEEQDGLLTLNIVIFMVRLRSTGNFIKGFGIFKIALSLFILVLFAVLEISIGQRLIISIIVGFEGIVWWNFGKRIIVCPVFPLWYTPYFLFYNDTWGQRSQ